MTHLPKLVVFQLNTAKRKQPNGPAPARIEEDHLFDACQRAVRNVPNSGEVAACAIRALVGLAPSSSLLRRHP